MATFISSTARASRKIVPGGTPQLVVPFPLRLDNNLTVNFARTDRRQRPGRAAVPIEHSAGDNRMFIWQDGQAKQILVLSATAATASTIDGRIVQSLDSFAFDDTGRVLAQLRFRGLAVPALGALGRQHVAHRGHAERNPRRANTC